MKIQPVMPQYVSPRLSTARGNANSSYISQRSSIERFSATLRDRRPLTNSSTAPNRSALQSQLSGNVTIPSDGRDRLSSPLTLFSLKNSSLTAALSPVVVPAMISRTNEQEVIGGIEPPPTDSVLPSTISSTTEEGVVGGIEPPPADSVSLSTISPTTEEGVVGGIAPPILPSVIPVVDGKWVIGGVPPKDPDA